MSTMHHKVNKLVVPERATEIMTSRPSALTLPLSVAVILNYIYYKGDQNVGIIQDLTMDFL